MILILKL